MVGRLKSSSETFACGFSAKNHISLNGIELGIAKWRFSSFSCNANFAMRVYLPKSEKNLYIFFDKKHENHGI